MRGGEVWVRTSSGSHSTTSVSHPTENARTTPVIADQVRDRLLAACVAAGVAVRYGAGLAGLEAAAADGAGGWRCRLQDGATFDAQRVVS